MSNLLIINADFLKTNFIKEESIDLIITSPPYNVDIKYETYDDNISYDKYLEFSEEWLKKAYSLLKNDGRICINVPFNKNKFGHECFHADIVNIARKIGFKYHTTIIWNKNHIPKRTAWGSFCSASSPKIIPFIEAIIVMYKNSWKKEKNGISDIKKEEFISWTNGLWSFPGENNKKIQHPAPFPLELPKRCIKLFSFVDDVILDPFMGSGTTLIAGGMLKRTVIGIEIDKKYCEIAYNRIKNFFKQKELF